MRLLIFPKLESCTLSFPQQVPDVPRHGLSGSFPSCHMWLVAPTLEKADLYCEVVALNSLSGFFQL